jgi:MFS family permease
VTAVSGEDTAQAKVGVRLILSDPAVRTVILIVFVVMLGFGIVAPVLPLYARSFGVGYGAAGLLISGFAMARLVVDPFSGPVVDRYGERLSASAGVAIVGVSSVLTGLAPTFAWAVIFRAAGGAGSAVLFTALTSYLLKIVPRDRMARTLGLFYGSFNVGVIAGGPVGGVVADRWGLAAPLFFYAGLLFVAGALYLRFVHDPPAREVDATGGTGPERFRDLMRRPGFATTIFLNFAYLWMVAAVFDTLVPLFGQEELGMSTVAIGGLFAVSLAAELVVLYPAGSLADRLGRRPILIPSMAGLAVMVAVLGFAPDAITLAILMTLLGFASGVAGVPPGAMLADVAPGERSGMAVGAFRFAGDLGFVFGPLVAGVSASAFGFGPAFWILSVPIAVGVILAVRTPETLRRGKSAVVPPGGGTVGPG